MDKSTGERNDPFDLSGQKAIVTGAGAGIGRAIALNLADRGARVAFWDVDETSVNLAAAGRVDCLPLRVDVTDSTSIQNSLDLIVARWGSVDILINCAGVSTPHTVDQLSEANWRKVLEINLTGPFLCSVAVLPMMIEQQRGKIVNVASVAARRISFNGSVAYTASKSGLLGLTRHMAYEVADHGINVNAICPGPTLTPLMHSLADEASLDARAKSIPMGRLNSVEDYVNTVMFLVSDLAEALCGVALEVDGGALLGWQDLATYREHRAKLTERFENRA